MASWHLIRFILLGAALLVFSSELHAQTASKQSAIDMILIIDNSCSMFRKAEIATLDCQRFGSDPDKQRIRGAQLFMARLGFAENNEEAYQIGAISMGENPPVVYPLRAVFPGPQRDEFSREISAPDPQIATDVIPALEAAYAELLNSGRNKLGNVPAIVFLTDGVPYPARTNTEAQIEAVVASHPNIPFFTILLTDNNLPAGQKEDFEKYSVFWERLGRIYDNADTYRVNSADDLIEIYNQIVGRLQDTFTGPEQPITANVPLPIFVNQYVQRLILTFVHEDAATRGTLEIRDPDNNVLRFDEPGVRQFLGESNPVEVISIDGERLDRSQRNADWTVTSDVAVNVFLDYKGAYRIRFLTPSVSATPLLNRYLAVQRHTPTQQFVMRFELVDNAEETLMTPQPIRGTVTDPAGNERELRIPVDLRPDSEGVYEVALDLALEFPDVLETIGRYRFVLNAGSAGEFEEEVVPIARAELLVDVGRAPFLEELSPNPFVCKLGEPTLLSVAVADLDAAQPGSVGVRVLAEGADLTPLLDADGRATADLADVCHNLLNRSVCDTESASTIRVRIVSKAADGEALPAAETRVPIRVFAVCTPTPTDTLTPTDTPTATHTPTATATHTPTPIPDTDRDTLLDPGDRCPQNAQWSIAPFFGGCPPPLWLQVVGVLTSMGLLALLLWFAVLPLWLRIDPPPDAWVLVCDGKGGARPRSIRAAGLDARRRSVTIGPRGHIRVAGLTRTFVVSLRGNRPVVGEQGKTGAGQTVYDQQSQISDGKITLKFSTDRNKLRC
jgi:hypothetical protein